MQAVDPNPKKLFMRSCQQQILWELGNIYTDYTGSMCYNVYCMFHECSSYWNRCKEGGSIQTHGTEIRVSKLCTQKYRNVICLMICVTRGTSEFPARPRPWAPDAIPRAGHDAFGKSTSDGADWSIQGWNMLKLYTKAGLLWGMQFSTGDICHIIPKFCTSRQIKHEIQLSVAICLYKNNYCHFMI